MAACFISTFPPTTNRPKSSQLLTASLNARTRFTHASNGSDNYLLRLSSSCVSCQMTDARTGAIEIIAPRYALIAGKSILQIVIFVLFLTPHISYFYGIKAHVSLNKEPSLLARRKWQNHGETAKVTDETLLSEWDSIW